MILVDTNILIDIFQNDAVWAEKSMEAMAQAAARVIASIFPTCAY
ncbi:putative nucleic acid-binding protein [Rhodoblastus acidophilus]|nr:hypothetical protein [Rhodoblastus acidophilus]MCW2283934.1 putative nucleic acid-binding protein [Rhodoblastus acidophilus]MCW2332630.1 putative nucleic acid-binding protein [Rhodoblastus acidophilus]